MANQTFIPTINQADAPWQIPLSNSFSPLASIPVQFPPADTFAPTSYDTKLYNTTHANFYEVTASVAASLGYGSYFKGNISANASLFISEVITYANVSVPSGTKTSWDPNSGVLNYYAGFGFRAFLLFGNMTASASATMSSIAASADASIQAFTAYVDTIGFAGSSQLAADVTAIESLLTSSGTFNVDVFGQYQAAVGKLIADQSNPDNASSIAPGWVGVDLNGASLQNYTYYNYPASVIYALRQINDSHTLSEAINGIGQVGNIPTAVPPITLDPQVIAQIYNIYCGSGNTDSPPSSAAAALAGNTVGIDG